MNPVLASPLPGVTVFGPAQTQQELKLKPGFSILELVLKMDGARGVPLFAGLHIE